MLLTLLAALIGTADAAPLDTEHVLHRAPVRSGPVRSAPRGPSAPRGATRSAPRGPSAPRGATRSAPATRSHPSTRPSARPPSARPSAPRPTAHGPVARPPARPAARPPVRPAARPPVRPAPAVRYAPAARYARPPVWGPRYRYAPVYPRVYGGGVFVYGGPRYAAPPPPPRGAPAATPVQSLPKGVIDRNGSLAVGLRGGAYLNATLDGGGYVDPGLGLFVRYRPIEFFGLEVAAQHHQGYRMSHTMGSASAELFLWPWKRVSPYGLVGVTAAQRGLASVTGAEEGTERPLIGPHVGGGIEFALGRKVGLDLEGRYIGYMNRRTGDPSIPGGVQLTAGLAMHF